MGQLWSSQRSVHAAYERRRKKNALKPNQSNANNHSERDYYFSPHAESPERLRHSQAASQSVTPKPRRGDRRAASSQTSHPSGVNTTTKAKKQKPSPPAKHQTQADAPKKQKQKSKPIKDKKAESSTTKHKSINRIDSHHAAHQPTKGKRECIVCTDTLSLPHFPNRPPTKTCNHDTNVCRKCLRTWITSESRTKIWNDIKCPTCSITLRKTDMRDFAPKHVYKRYLTLTHHTTASSLPDFLFCPLKNCSAGQIHVPTSSSPKFLCNACKRSSCAVHHVKWHKGESCREYDYRKNAKLKKEEEDASRKVLAETTKKCPGCGRAIEKSGGCDHMKCAKCLVHFCWKCLLPLYPSRGQGHCQCHRFEEV